MSFRLAVLTALAVALLCLGAVRMFRPDMPVPRAPSQAPKGPFDARASRYPMAEEADGVDPAAAAGVLEARIRDDTGRGIKGAIVLGLRGGAVARDLETVLSRAETDERGRCSIVIPDDISSVDIAVAATGFRPEYRADVPLSAGTVEVCLVAGSCIKGRVVDGLKRPLADTDVYALGPGIPQVPDSLDALPVPELLDRGAARTGSDGTFVLSGLAEDTRYALFALKDGYAAPLDFENRVDAVLAGGDPVTLVLYPAYRVRYRVVDPVTLEPPGDPRLWPDPVSKGIDLPGAGASSGILSRKLASRPPWDVDELWVFPEERESIGPVRIGMFFPGYLPLQGAVDAGRYDPVHAPDPVLLKLTRDKTWREPGRLTLHFVQPDGSPVLESACSGASRVCTLRAVEGAKAGLEFVFSPSRDGTMTFERLPSGRYYFISRLGIVTKSLALTSFEVSGGDHTDVTVGFPFLGTVEFGLPPEAVVPPYFDLELNSIPATGHAFTEFAVGFHGRVATLPYLPEGRYSASARGYGVLPRRFEFNVEAGRTTRARLPVPEER